MTSTHKHLKSLSWGGLNIREDVVYTASAWYGMTMGTKEDAVAHRDLVEELKAQCHRFAEENDLDPKDITEVSTLEGASVKMIAQTYLPYGAYKTVEAREERG